MGKTHGWDSAHRPVFNLQLQCHVAGHLDFAKPHCLNSFQDYKSASSQKILFLEGRCENREARLPKYMYSALL